MNTKLPRATIGHTVAEPIPQVFVTRVAGEGWRVRGLRQESPLPASASDPACAPQPQSAQPGCQRDMELVDVAPGQRGVISQDPGPGSLSCCLSANGVVAARAVLRRALSERPDLIVTNRFGRLEAQGSGLRQEMAVAVEAGLPLVTADAFLSDWQAFTGGLTNVLPATDEALDAWWQDRLAGRQTQVLQWCVP
ncbi:DUF2478 domain-containing protein [Corticibacter populi]|uniref:DUF2478 domain-containing protein n=1 Tax=Corticibacter populi TaxID=1550736 RepID=A0A3M6QME2_9BURK|nr:DUF2478 domain-containing protein [Corticibacter populi]RMX04216.1 DUF2478 domain-containing protein [Corticibacter populi]RZS33246.1 uncharacterized protein DUF2478 [Corticibacter populi]